MCSPNKLLNKIINHKVTETKGVLIVTPSEMEDIINVSKSTNEAVAHKFIVKPDSLDEAIKLVKCYEEDGKLVFDEVV